MSIILGRHTVINLFAVRNAAEKFSRAYVELCVPKQFRIFRPILFADINHQGRGLGHLIDVRRRIRINLTRGADRFTFAGCD